MRSLFAALVIAAPGFAQGEVDFESHVLPILKEHCIKCHQAPYRDDRGRLQKPKGGLRLDGKAWILAGGDAGEVVVPGEPDDSVLLEVTMLDPDDPDIMPAKGDPLSKREIEVLRSWIAGGAQFGAWVGTGSGEDGPKARRVVVPPRVRLLEKLASGLQAPTGARLRKLAGDDAQIRPTHAGSPLLRVSFRSSQHQVDDARLAKLSAIGPHVTHLDLSRSGVTAKGLRGLKGYSRLVHLDLHETDVDDAALRAIAALPELRVLNLWGTRVGDAGLKEVAKLPHLERLYLWQTDATEGGIETLRKARPALRIQRDVALPAPAPADGDGGGRRR